MKPLVSTEYDGTTPRLALLLRERLDPPTQSWGRYWVLTAEVISLADDDTPRNLTDPLRQPLAGFALRAQQDAERAKRAATEADPFAADPYGSEVMVDASSLGNVSLRMAEVIVGTHRTIARRMATLEKTFGRPRSTVAFFLAAAAAMGIDTFVVTLAHGADGTYSSGSYLLLNPDEAASRIESMIVAANSALREA